MTKALPALVAILFITSYAPASESSRVARAFVRVPERYVGHVTKADRKFFVAETLKQLKRVQADPGSAPSHIYQGRNLNFSWDGEEEMSGEGPLTFHRFDAPRHRLLVGVFIMRFYNPRRPATSPPTSLYILSFDGVRWADITSSVLPQPFDPRLCYEFSSSSDVLTVRTYTSSKRSFMVAGRVLGVWRWTGNRFVPACPPPSS